MRCIKKMSVCGAFASWREQWNTLAITLFLGIGCERRARVQFQQLESAGTWWKVDGARGPRAALSLWCVLLMKLTNPLLEKDQKDCLSEPARDEQSIFKYLSCAIICLYTVRVRLGGVERLNYSSVCIWMYMAAVSLAETRGGERKESSRRDLSNPLWC